MTIPQPRNRHPGTSRRDFAIPSAGALRAPAKTLELLEAASVKAEGR
jgi:hypothetical protein